MIASRSIQMLVRLIVNRSIIISLFRIGGMPEYSLYRTDVNGYTENVLTVGEYQIRLSHWHGEIESDCGNLTLGETDWYLLNEVYDTITELAEGRAYAMKMNYYPEDWTRLFKKILSIHNTLKNAPAWANVETSAKVFYTLADMLSAYHAVLRRGYKLKF